MATRPKAIIESRNGEEFSPITIAKNVLTDDGQNLHDILSDRKEDMMTPTIENSSSMFKVGQGDNVNYSANVVNGAYESMVLKGKTMVNCIQESSSQDIVLPYEFEDGRYVTINDTKESGALGVELKGQTLVNLARVRSKQVGNAVGEVNIPIKPNTKYIAFSDVTYENASNLAMFLVSPIYVESISGLNGDALYTATVSGKGGTEVGWNQTGAKYVTFTSASNQCYLHIRTGGSTSNLKYNNMQVFEYQEGMENWDIPYFEGVASCKMPTLHTVGKNVVNEKTWKIEAEEEGYQCLLSAGYATETGKTGDPIIIPVHVEKGKVYTLKCKNKATRHFNYFYLMDDLLNGKVKSFRRSIGANMTLNSFVDTIITFTADRDYKYLQIDTGEPDANGYIVKNTLQLEEGSNNTTYESYKSSILSLPEEVVLRSLPNGVCDTFNTRTGVYTQRIKEVVFDGSNDESWNVFTGDWVLENSTVFCTYISGVKGYTWSQYTGKEAISDKIPSYPDIWLRLNDVLGMTNDNTGARKQFRIPKSYLETDNVNGFRKWLEQNPVTACFELATPIITKINLPSTLKLWNTTTHIYSEIPENTLYPTLSHSNPTYPVILKPNTKYSIVANSYSNNHTNSAINFNLGGATASTTVGNRVTTITTPSTLSNELLTMSGRGNKLNNVMVIEGDVVGDEPYFEGICDCKSPILSNTGLTLYESPFEKVYGEGVSREFFNMMDLAPYVDKWGVNKNYTFSFDIKANKSGTAQIYFQNGTGSRHDFRFTVPVTTEYVRHTVTTRINGTDYNWKESKFACFTTYDTGCFATIKNIQFALGTSIEPYKSNITTFDQKDGKTIVLRSLPNGVCDTLNVETGEYVQKIGEIVLDGVNNKFSGINGNSEYGDGRPRFDIQIEDIYMENANRWNDASKVLICDKLKPGYLPNFASNKTSNVIAMWENILTVIFEDASITTIKQANEYLQQNPITVQYELATPVISTIDIQGFPHAYTNGHVQLSSGSIEQSLTPKVEYSVVTNRNGQIRSNQKMVERHQKQLDRLQAMILTNLVNTQYEQALTNLKYDLKNVREEVK